MCRFDRAPWRSTSHPVLSRDHSYIRKYNNWSVLVEYALYWGRIGAATILAIRGLLKLEIIPGGRFTSARLYVQKTTAGVFEAVLGTAVSGSGGNVETPFTWGWRWYGIQAMNNAFLVVYRNRTTFFEVGWKWHRSYWKCGWLWR